MRHKMLGAAVGAAAAVILASPALAAPAWTVDTSVDPSPTTNVLNAVSARTATDAWAVGDDKLKVDDATFAMLVEHWNGTQWSQVATPDLPASDEKLFGVSASGASDVWAVGFQGPPGRRPASRSRRTGTAPPGRSCRPRLRRTAVHWRGWPPSHRPTHGR